MENANQFKQKARVFAKASGLRLAEGLGVLLICLLALRLAYPTAVNQRSTHVVANSSDPYAVGDLGGALFMVTRSASGERGCDITTHGHPFDGWDICREIPNPLVTDLLADLVGLFGMPLGYNLGLLLFLASNGLAVYIVVRLAGARGPPALFGAMAASIAPSLFSELEGGFVQHAWWAPAILATGLCVGAIRSWSRFWWIVPGALCLVWSLPVYSMLPFKLLPWTLAAGAVAVFTGEDRKGKLIRAGLGGAIAVGMSLPYAMAALGGESAGTRVWSGPADEQALHKMMGAMAHSPGDFFSMSFGSADLIRIPGVVTWVTLIAVAVSYRQFRHWGPALGGALVLLLISLGPSVGSGPFNDSLPHVSLMDNVEIARGSMRPIRYGVAGLFLLCIASGIALS